MEFEDGHLDLKFSDTTYDWSCGMCGKSGDVWTKPEDYVCKYVQDPLF